MHRRKGGWLAEHPSAVVVARPGPFGNPFSVAAADDAGYSRRGQASGRCRAANSATRPPDRVVQAELRRLSQYEASPSASATQFPKHLLPGRKHET